MEYTDPIEKSWNFAEQLKLKYGVILFRIIILTF